MALVKDDNGLGKLVDATEAEAIAKGLAFTEGPVWAPGGYLLFSDIPRNNIHRWTRPDGLSVWRHPSGQSNGLTFDRQGRLLACEHGNRRVSRTEPDGTIVALAERYQGKRLNSPNDIIVHSSGAIFFTDPPYGIKREQQELAFQGLYRLDTSGQLTLLADDFDRPNGLALSPDEKTLYVDDSNRMHVRAFDVTAELGLTKGRVFAEYRSRSRHSPDGMKVDTEGRVYATGGGGLFVWAADGTHLGVIVLPHNPANVAWGDADRNVLYLTAGPAVYRVPMKVKGFAVGT